MIIKSVSVEGFKNLSGVLDVVYNPARTALLLQAEELGIPCACGLYMLVAQAVAAQEIWQDAKYDSELIVRIMKELEG